MNGKMAVLLIAALLMSQTASVYAADALNNAVGISISIVNQDPDPALAGDIVEVRLGVENKGGLQANNVNIQLTPEYPFSLVPGEDAVQNIGTMLGYQGQYDGNMKIVKYRLQVDKNAPAGSYELKANYYTAGSNASFTQKGMYIDVKSKESAEVIYIDKTALVPGKQSSLKFTINNVGNAPLRDISFNWVNNDKIILPVGSDNTRYIKYIDVGGSVTLEYQVVADSNANAGLYQLNLYLTYRDSVNNTERQVSTIAGVYVGGGTDFDVAFSDSSSGSTSFSVANVGSNPAYSVSVIVPDQKGWSISGPNAVIIGNLNKGDYTVASFNLAPLISANAQNRTGARGFNYTQNNSPALSSTQDSVLMQIAYTDTTGERQVIDKNVKIGIQNIAAMNATGGFSGRGAAAQQGFLSTYKWYIAGIAVIIAWLFMRRRQRSHKSS